MVHFLLMFAKNTNLEFQMVDFWVTPWVTILFFFFFFFNSNGKSTIDYMLSSIDLFHDIQYFNIQPPNELSDHCLVSTGIFSDFENIVTNGEHYTR